MWPGPTQESVVNPDPTQERPDKRISFLDQLSGESLKMSRVHLKVMTPSLNSYTMKTYILSRGMPTSRTEGTEAPPKKPYHNKLPKFRQANRSSHPDKKNGQHLMLDCKGPLDITELVKVTQWDGHRHPFRLN